MQLEAKQAYYAWIVQKQIFRYHLVALKLVSIPSTSSTVTVTLPLQIPQNAEKIFMWQV